VKERNTSLYLLCVMIFISVTKCAVNKELKLWLWLEEIIFLSISTGIVIMCFIEFIVLSETQLCEVPVVARYVQSLGYTFLTASRQYREHRSSIESAVAALT